MARVMIVGAKQWIMAAAAERNVAELLDLAVGEPMLRLERVTQVADGLSVESVRAFCYPERYRNYSELAPQPSGLAQLAKLEDRRAQGGKVRYSSRGKQR